MHSILVLKNTIEDQEQSSRKNCAHANIFGTNTISIDPMHKNEKWKLKNGTEKRN